MIEGKTEKKGTERKVIDSISTVRIIDRNESTLEKHDDDGDDVLNEQ